MMRIIRIFALIAGLGTLFISSVSYHYKKQIHEDEVNLILFYGSFDDDRDGFLSIGEMANFFYWCQSEITYEAHEFYMSPVSLYKIRRGDCLELSLFAAHFFYVYFRGNAYVGNIAVENQGTRVNHACCLLAITKDAKKKINQKLGYQVDYYTDPSGEFYYLIIDPLCCRRFGELNTRDYCLMNIKYLHEFHLTDISTIIVDH